MGSYELLDEELHYTGDGWLIVKLSKEEIELYKKGKLDCFKVFNDGRTVY